MQQSPDMQSAQQPPEGGTGRKPGKVTRPKLRKPPSKEAIERDLEDAESRLQKLDGWTEQAATQTKTVRGSARTAQAKARDRAGATAAPAPQPPGQEAPAADDPKAELKARIYGVSLEATEVVFVRVPRRLKAMLEEVRFQRRHKSLQEFLALQYQELAEQHLGVSLYKDGEAGKAEKAK